MYDNLYAVKWKHTKEECPNLKKTRTQEFDAFMELLVSKMYMDKFLYPRRLNCAPMSDSLQDIHLRWRQTKK